MQNISKNGIKTSVTAQWNRYCIIHHCWYYVTGSYLFYIVKTCWCPKFPSVIRGKGIESPRKLLRVVLSVIKNPFLSYFLFFLLLEENLLWHQHFSGLVSGVNRSRDTFIGKLLVLKKKCMDKRTLIYFLLRVCDVLLIGYQSGRLRPNQDQGILMPPCRAEAGFVFLLLLHRHRGYSVHFRPAKVTLTAYQKALRRRRDEMRKCDGGKREESLERCGRGHKTQPVKSVNSETCTEK